MKNLGKSPIVSFLVLTFLIAWLIWLWAGFFAPKWFFFCTILGAWSPTLAAFYLTYHHQGKAGIKVLTKNIFRWRVGFFWYLFTFFSTAVFLLLAIGIDFIWKAQVPTITPPANLSLTAFFVFLPLILLVNIFLGGPLAEDIGWRGYLLPLLSEKMSTLRAALLVGVIWVIWHLPFFWFPEGKMVVAGIPLLWFSLITIAWSVFFAWLYFGTRGSIFMPVLYHAAINTTLGSTDAMGFADNSGNLGLLIGFTVFTCLGVLGLWYIKGESLGKEKQ
jgi:membrane protease YdiL (CAAX protease family)